MEKIEIKNLLRLKHHKKYNFCGLEKLMIAFVHFSFCINLYNVGNTQDINYGAL